MFYLLFISRVAAFILLSFQGAEPDSGLLVSVILSIPAGLVLSVPAILCVSKRKNPLESGCVSGIYGVLFSAYTGVAVYELTLFCRYALGAYSKNVILAVMIIAAVCYCASLGIEGVSRFSGFAFLLFAGGITVLLALNFSEGEVIRIMPISLDKTSAVNRTVFISTSMSELAAYLSVSRRVNGKSAKPVVLFELLSGGVILLIGVTVFAVLGAAAQSFAYPVFTLSQTATIGGFERLDAIFSSVFILAGFLRCALFGYCAVSSFRTEKGKTSAFFCGALSLFAYFILIITNAKQDYVNIFHTATFAVFAVLLPLLWLIFKKRNAGDELIETL